MINLQGIPVNLEHEILGKVHARYCGREEGRETLSFLLTNKESRSKSTSKCIVTNARQKATVQKYKKTPAVYGVDNLENLRKGDILLIEPTGGVNVIYKKDSNDNSLLITQRCDSTCIMCPQPPVQRDSNMTLLNLNLIRLIDKNTHSLALTGGEPAVVREDLLRIMTECRNELPATSLILLTNGIAFEDIDYVETLASISHPDLTVAVSLYSDVDTKHNKVVGTHGFYRTLRGIYNLALFKQKVEIRTVVHRLTYERLPNLAEFIAYNFPFVVHVALMGLETTGLAHKNIDELWIDPYEYRKELKSAVQTLHRNDLGVSIYNHQLCILPPSLWKFSRQSISDWKNIYLDICERCEVRDECGGLFASSELVHSNHLEPLTEESTVGC